MKHKVALFGAGKIGEAITGLLSQSQRYEVIVCDADEARASYVANLFPRATPKKLDLSDEAAVAQLLASADAVLSALPFYCNPAVARAACRAETHYLDLTEDVATTTEVTQIARESTVAFLPQCGLAPGFISIAAAFLATSFDTLATLKMRVGALPLFPTNRLKYNLSWSTEGLINEYLNPCEVITKGKRTSAAPLEGLEQFSIDGVAYEAFNTSGGLGTLCDTLEDKLESLNYKSIRYPGHRDFIAFLMEDLKFEADRETLVRVFDRSIPATEQDKVLIFVQATGQANDRLLQRSYVSTIYHKSLQERPFSAIQITTAAGACAPLDLLLEGKLAEKKGLIKCEDIPLELFLQNEFGKHYADKRAMELLCCEG